MPEEVVLLVCFVAIVVGGVVLMVAAMHNRRRLQEMAHRERLAMIERNLMPSPEVDPARFEAAAGLEPPPVRGPVRGERFRTIGVAMIGMGLGFAVLIGLAGGSAEVGLGIGGAWAILGGASLVNYFLISREPHR